MLARAPAVVIGCSTRAFSVLLRGKSVNYVFII